MCNCSQNTNLNPCSPCTTSTSCTTGCSYTINTDCVIFNKELLPSESPSVVPNSSRNLTTILQNIHNLPLLESEFHTIGDGPFTLDSNSNNKLIILEDIEGVVGYSSTITLPSSLDYAGKVYTFVNKTPVSSGQWLFNVPLITDYDPLTTSTNYNTIVPDAKKVLKLTFVQTTPVSWGWIIL